MRIRTAARIAAGAVISTAAAGAFVLTAQYVPAQAAVTARHVPAVKVSCAVQLQAINAAERGTIGARGLAAAGLPELAATARAAGTLSGARWYGIALEATSDALNGCHHVAQLPAWLHVGSSQDRGCLTVWGGQGDTSAEVCSNGRAFTS